MKKEIIILANSWRPEGRCVAGICLETKKWIRPVYQTQNAIPEKDVQHIGLLEIVKINLLENQPKTKYQRENYFIDTTKNDNWEIIGAKNLNDIEQFCQQYPQTLHSDKEYTEQAHMEKLKPKEWKSLTLVRKNVKFEKQKTTTKWHGSFNDGSGMNLPLTDPYATEILNQNYNKKTENYLMTISLGEPWTPQNTDIPQRCYKLIAGVLDFHAQE